MVGPVMSRAVHPPVECAVEGCGRVTRTIPALREGQYDLETGEPRRQMLCGAHWRRVPVELKRRRQKLFRLWDRRARDAQGLPYWQLPPGSSLRIAIVSLEATIRATWSRCVRIAAGDVPPSPAGLPPAVQEELRRLGL